MTVGRTAVFALGLASVFWMGATAQQEMRPRPGPGSGSMDVNVINRPVVGASQAGEWRVTLSQPAEVKIANQPTVALAGPSFLRPGGAYRVTWADGHAETVTAVQSAGGGWVQVRHDAGARWINLAAARAVEAQ